MIALFRRFSGTAARLGLASLAVQLSSFTLLFFAKVRLSDDGFAYLMMQSAFAGILGSVATLRLEILIWQHFGRFTIAAVLVPLTTALVFVSLILAAVNSFAALGWTGFAPSPWSAALALGLGLGVAQDFLLIQSQRSDLVLASRLTQGVFLMAAAIVVAFNLFPVDGPAILAMQGLSLILPVVAWVFFFIVSGTNSTRTPTLYVPKSAMIYRSLSLSFSVLVNSIYVNLPLLAAAATQSAAFTADFGLILRLLTGPVTLIRQVFGQIFQARGLVWSTAPNRRIGDLLALMHGTMLKSLVSYLAIALLVVLGLYFAKDFARIEHPELAWILLVAVAAQSVVIPVASIRTILKDEQAYVFVDVLRCATLGAALLLPWGVGFAACFGLTSCILYISYYFFMRVRMKRLNPV